MSGGTPVFVTEMYSPRGRMRSRSVHSGASCLREETSFSCRFLDSDRARQVRMACWKDSGSIPHWGLVVLGFSSKQEGWAAM